MKLQGQHKIFTFAFVLLVFSGGSFVHAQTSSLVPEPLQFVVSPETPGPNQLVTIEVQGVGTFLGNATVTWQQDGKTVLSGVGERKYVFTTKSLGTKTRIHVTVNSPSKGNFTRDFLFIPSSVTLLWEADTAVPLLYKGKALYSAGSRVRVTAFPTVVANGATISSNNLSFQWSLNNVSSPTQSGKGRNTFSFEGSQLQDAENISVEVYLDSVKVAKGGLTMRAAKPQIVLYNRDPLRGILYDQALPSAISLFGKEITVQAIGYFFSNKSLKNGMLEYAWEVNGRKATGPDTGKGILTLRQTGSGKGQALLTVSVQDISADTFVQSASTALTLVFGQGGNTGVSSFFGL